MTRSKGKGENEITAAVKREAMRTGVPIEEILARMRAAAKQAKDTAQRMKIVEAEKYLHQRNHNKRRNRR